MRPDLIAFGDEHVDEAAALVALRWRPTLSARTQPPRLPAALAPGAERSGFRLPKAMRRQPTSHA
ncbi:MAG TPA: hypothetical protein VMV29_19295 [Ktedonobacterales bacterium]|nr:hypothetical protein [Ktedonobacterales bacterium]